MSDRDCLNIHSVRVRCTLTEHSRFWIWSLLQIIHHIINKILEQKSYKHYLLTQVNLVSYHFEAFCHLEERDQTAKTLQ